MKPKRNIDTDDILPEYDFSRSRPNKYARRYSAGFVPVLLDPDVAAVFRDATEVNDALRALVSVAEAKVASRRKRGNGRRQAVKTANRSRP